MDVMINKEKRSNPAFWITSLYFAMGLPFVAISVASSIMYKSMGIPDKSIAFWTSLIMLPWTIKPLWSPVLEMFKTKKYFVVFYRNIHCRLLWFGLHFFITTPLFCLFYSYILINGFQWCYT